MGTQYCFRVELLMFEGGNVSLVYGSEVDEEHIYVVRTSNDLLVGECFEYGCWVCLVGGVEVQCLASSTIGEVCCVPCWSQGVARSRGSHNNSMCGCWL